MSRKYLTLARLSAPRLVNGKPNLVYPLVVEPLSVVTADDGDLLAHHRDEKTGELKRSVYDYHLQARRLVGANEKPDIVAWLNLKKEERAAYEALCQTEEAAARDKSSRKAPASATRAVTETPDVKERDADGESESA